MTFEWRPPTIPWPELYQDTRDDGTRQYVLPCGTRYPSVTTVLGTEPNLVEALVKWRNRIGHEEAELITKQAAERGTWVHENAERYLKGQELEKGDIFLDQMMAQMKKVLNKSVDKVKHTEVQLYSHILKVAGTCDLIAEFDGQLSIIDFKTSTKFKEEAWIKNYYMQCSAYSLCYEEMTGLSIPNVVIIIACEDENGASIYKGHRNDHIADFIKLRKAYK